MSEENKTIKMKKEKILITGSAGFIGFHLVSRFLQEDRYEIFGLDVINEYYNIELKYDRLEEHGVKAQDIVYKKLIQSSKFSNYNFLKADIADHDFMVDFMECQKFDYVINLAAQAGVRYSLDNPKAYIHSNIDGFLTLLEGCRRSFVKHFVYASTSSVYGLNTKLPLSEKNPTEHPISLYAATKKSNELMAHTYSHLFQLPTTGLRFFTVYGPWGRPDMAIYLFSDAIVKNKPLDVFNYGNMVRDFTYVDDVTEAIKRITLKPSRRNLEWKGIDPNSESSSAPYKIFNIGNSSPIKLSIYIDLLEKEFSKEAIKNFIDIQPGDVSSTHADTHLLEEYIDFTPSTTVEEGVSKFVEWYKNYHEITY